MSENIKSKVIIPLLFLLFSCIKLPVFSISHSYLCLSDDMLQMTGIMKNFSSANPLETTSKAADVFQVLIHFFDKTELSWSKLVGVCTDGAPAMIGANSGFVFPDKAEKSSNSRNALHDSQSGAHFQNRSEETS